MKSVSLNPDDVFGARVSLKRFSEYCFGFENKPFHERWYEIIQDKDNKSGLIIAPRNSAKSTCWGKVAPLWLLGNDPDLRILILGRTSALAKTDMRFIRLQVESNDRVHEVFPYEEINGVVTGLKASSPWGEDWLTVENNRRDGVPSVYAVGLEGSISGFRADIIIVDDLIDINNVMTDGQREKVDAFWNSVVVPTLNPGGRIFLVGCLTGDARISMADGSWKPITECKVGEKVVSHDSIETVEAVVPQGKADVYELKTDNQTIEATGNHPFLCDRKRGRVFVKLEDLVVGDYVYCNHKREGGDSPFGLDSETMWVLGFMFGDGWITHNPNKFGSQRWVVCFAKSVQQWKNERMLEYFKDRFNANPHNTEFGYYRMNNAKLGRRLESLGFKGKAKTKRIPSYVFGLSEKLRESFLEGFSAADGCLDTLNSTSIELCNKELILDLKHLGSGLGYRNTNIYERYRLVKPPHSPKEFMSYSAHVRLGGTKINEKWRKMRVKSIKYVGEKEVYDLTISNTHNFIANGLVVHNTRYHSKDFYSRMLDDPMYYLPFIDREGKEHDRIFMFPALKLDEDGDLVLIPKLADDGVPLVNKDGESLMKPISYWPERWPVSELLNIKERMGSLAFNSQYQCDPSGYAGKLFDPEHLHYYDPTRDLTSVWGNLDFIMSVDPNITEDPESDNTAIVTGAIDRKNGTLYILDIYAKPLGFVNQVKVLKQYGSRLQVSVGSRRFETEIRISKIGVESVAYQRSLQQSGYLMGLPVVEVKQGNRNKEIRILGIQPHIENGRILFPNPDKVTVPWWEGFYTEYCTFPKGRRDDRLDALEILVTMVSGSFGMSGIPWGPTDDAPRRFLRGIFQGGQER